MKLRKTECDWYATASWATATRWASFWQLWSYRSCSI